MKYDKWKNVPYCYDAELFISIFKLIELLKNIFVITFLSCHLCIFVAYLCFIWEVKSSLKQSIALDFISILSHLYTNIHLVMYCNSNLFYKNKYMYWFSYTISYILLLIFLFFPKTPLAIYHNVHPIIRLWNVILLYAVRCHFASSKTNNLFILGGH